MNVGDKLMNVGDKLMNVRDKLVYVWDKLTTVMDNVIIKDNEEIFSLSAASLTEVGHRGELGIDRPGLKNQKLMKFVIWNFTSVCGKHTFLQTNGC